MDIENLIIMAIINLDNHQITIVTIPKVLKSMPLIYMIVKIAIKWEILNIWQIKDDK